mgnify:FL=1
MTENPLKKYSERPGTYITLPSGGRYYDTPPRMTADDELEVRPMTASDEIRLKNPDGLMNSDSLYQVIEHIAPGITDARKIPTPDLDIIVIGMRIATYGETMNINVRCTKCSHDSEYQINLMGILANARKIEGADQVEIGELKVNIMPHTSESNTMLNNYQVELVRAARAIESAIAADKEPLNQQLSEIIDRGSRLVFEIATKHIRSVETPDGIIVTEPDFIAEFLRELPAPEYQIIRDAVNKLSKEVIDRSVKFKCGECDKENKVEVAFDPANFFANSSL